MENNSEETEQERRRGRKRRSSRRRRRQRVRKEGVEGVGKIEIEIGEVRKEGVGVRDVGKGKI